MNNIGDWFEGWDKEDQNGDLVSPAWMDLTPNGKTLVVIYPGNHQEEIAEAFIGELGEPEGAGPSEECPENLVLLFPHQDLPEPLRDVAERMTTHTQLRYLSSGGNRHLDLPVPAADEPATLESILQFTTAFSKVAYLDGKGWEHFRGRFLSFGNKELRAWPGPEAPKIKDIAPKLWGFYSGYMACEGYFHQQLAEIESELKGLTKEV